MRFVDVIVEQQNFHVEITVYLIWPLILLWIQVAEMSFFRRVAGFLFRGKVPVLIFKYKGNVQNCISYKGIQLRSPTVMLWERLAEARLRREVLICEQRFHFVPEQMQCFLWEIHLLSVCLTYGTVSFPSDITAQFYF